jgi:hypothetical protein
VTKQQAAKTGSLCGCHVQLAKYLMRITELLIKPIKPKPPMTLPQARIHGLKQGVQRSKDQLKQERERQKQQRDNERKRQQLKHGLSAL